MAIFSKYFVLSTLLFAAIFAYPYYHWRYPGMMIDIFWGWLLAAVNVAVGFWAIRWAYPKPNKEFFKIVFGSMGIRMLFIGIVLVLTILFSNVHVPTFVFTLLAFYIGYLAVEVKLINGLNKESIN